MLQLRHAYLHKPNEFALVLEISVPEQASKAKIVAAKTTTA